MGLRVLHVIPAIAPRYGGPSAAVIGMGRALIKEDVQPLIATTDADGAGKRLEVELGRAHSFSDVPTIFFRRTVSESFKYSRSLGRWLRRHVAGHDVVHIHAVFSYSSISAARACIAARVPYIVRTLDPWSLGRHSLRKQLLLRVGARTMLQRAALIHYTTDEERVLAQRMLPWLPASRVVPIGVDERFFRAAGPPEVDPRGPYVLFMGRLDGKKGIDFLIQAFHDAVERGLAERWSLVIAGDGDPAYVLKLKALAADRVGRSQISFRGWVKGDERRTLLRRAELFALPSHQENFGIAVVEAFASGVPAIVTPGVNISSQIREAGAGWVVEREREAFSAALAAVFSDDEERRARRRAARELAERYRWSVVGPQLVDMYQQARSR